MLGILIIVLGRYLKVGSLDPSGMVFAGLCSYLLSPENAFHTGALDPKNLIYGYLDPWGMPAEP